MKLWIDDVRPAPESYVWCRSVNEAKALILKQESICNDLYRSMMYNDNPLALKFILDKVQENCIELIDIDHDAGEFYFDGGDYIKLLDWIEERGREYPIRIHSMNPVGVSNMKAIIQRNNWKEVL